MHILGLRITAKLVLLLLFIVCGLLLLDQIYLYFRVTTQGTNFPRSLHLDDVHQLLLAGRDTGVTPILFDPVILQAWQNNRNVSPTGVCVFFCHVIGPLSFAITQADLKDKPTFLTRLAQLGFVVTVFETSDGKKSHIILLRVGSPLHVIILHWSHAGYWRQYLMDGPPHSMAQVKKYITKETWHMMSTDRAYERFDTAVAKIDGLDITVPSDIRKFAEDYKEAHFIPCNTSQATYFYLKHPKDEGTEATRFRHKAWKLLAKTKTILDQLQIPFWLSSGTCLGFFRQCDIISWANDVDIGIFIENYNSKLIDEFASKGLHLVSKFGKVQDSLEYSFKEDDVKLDIFFFYTEGASMWNGGTQAKTGRKFKYSFPEFSLCWTEFLDLKVRVPCQTKEYIIANYGQQWFTPVHNWDWKSSPPNVQENGMWPEYEWAEVIVLKNR